MRNLRSVRVVALGLAVAVVAALLTVAMSIGASAVSAQGTLKAGIVLTNASAAFSQSASARGSTSAL